MKINRRNFLFGTFAFTFAGCTQFNQSNLNNKRELSSINPLGIRLSKDNEEIKNYYKAIVIGSGYGASVIACRLADHFGDLCVLERGREWHPGDFAEDPLKLASVFKNPLNPHGLIDIAPGDGIDIVCGNGLGGTSLINAAISIRPEMNVFDLDVWPKAIQEAAHSGELEKYYLKAESILKPNKMDEYRFTKSIQHRENAVKFKRPYDELNLNIQKKRSENVFKNEFGYPQSGCVQCGNCCSGCNYGAKNTLLTNYLYLAFRKGAHIFTSSEVEKIEKVGSQYQLTVKMYNRFGFFSYKNILTDNLFLGAGSKGSTEILLKSESNSFQFSTALGSKLSANGDVMGMAYNTDVVTNIIAKTGDQINKGEKPTGTIISSYANYRNGTDKNEILNQFLLLDGVVPSALAPTVANSFAQYFLQNKDVLYKNLSEDNKKTKLYRIQKDIGSLSVSPEGALAHSSLYFACGHDSSGGKFIYDRNRKTVSYSWKNAVVEPTILRIQKVMQEYATFNGGTFVENPRMKVFGGNIQATHPLGGCPMGDDIKSSVVDHIGRVYDRRGGVHNNLYVVDAAILPHSLAATPLLTITAFAERIADKVRSM